MPNDLWAKMRRRIGREYPKYSMKRKNAITASILRKEGKLRRRPKRKK